MHDDEQVATAAQVARLVAAQFPHWAHLPVAEVDEFGTDHRLFRLGDDLVARMPRAPWATDQARSDARWLAHLAPYLPVAVPTPLAVGEPGEGYPWPWSVVPWLPGRPPVAYETAGLADQLARFVRALHAVPDPGVPPATGTSRGAPVARLDEPIRALIASLAGELDAPAVTAAWEHAVTAPAWDDDPVVLHGDLGPGNLLVEGGRLTAVIDWGALAAGDPAVDLTPAWTLLSAGERERFRDAVGYDDATWRRAAGWALAPALTGIPYYRETMPAFAERGRRTIRHVLASLP